MIIAIPYQDGQIFEHFGHAETFAIYEYDENQPEKMTKCLIECGDRHGHKAMAELMKENKVDVVLAGHMGDEARSLLLSYQIVPIAGYCGHADTAADMLIDGTLPIAEEGAGGCSGGCGGACGGCGGGCGGEEDDGGCGCGCGCH